LDFTTFVDLLGPLCGGFAVHYVKSVLNVVSSMSRKSPIECVLSRLSAILTILIILFSSIHIITESYRIAAYLPIYHVDGDFQHASPLFRMESGHFPGRDFYPYVGIIPNMLNYPLPQHVRNPDHPISELMEATIEARDADPPRQIA